MKKKLAPQLFFHFYSTHITLTAATLINHTSSYEAYNYRTPGARPGLRLLIEQTWS